MTLPTHYIQSLDLFLPSAGVTLRQAIMGIKTSAENPTSLFISTDTDSWGRVIFTFHKSQDTEAANIVPVLPIYLTHHYGNRAWAWFNEEAKEELAEYYYDEPSGEIRCHEDEYIQEIIDETRWESLDDQETQVEFSLAQWVVDIEHQATANQYGDNGTVKTGANTSTGGDSKTNNTTTTEEGLSTLTGDTSKDQLISLLLKKSEQDLNNLLNLLGPSIDSDAPNPNMETTESQQE